jgi:hypothetical protein
MLKILGEVVNLPEHDLVHFVVWVDFLATIPFSEKLEANTSYSYLVSERQKNFANV